MCPPLNQKRGCYLMDHSHTAYSWGKGSFQRKSKGLFSEEAVWVGGSADASPLLPCVEPESIHAVRGRYMDAIEHFISSGSYSHGLFSKWCKMWLFSKWCKETWLLIRRTGHGQRASEYQSQDNIWKLVNSSPALIVMMDAFIHLTTKLDLIFPCNYFSSICPIPPQYTFFNHSPLLPSWPCQMTILPWSATYKSFKYIRWSLTLPTLIFWLT